MRKCREPDEQELQMHLEWLKTVESKGADKESLVGR